MPSPLDLLTPPRCALCTIAGPLLCSRCLLRLPLIGGPLCERCGAPAERALDACAECRGRRLGFDTARAAVLHDGAGRELVHALKTGAPPPVDPMDAVVGLEVLMAAFESARTGAVVPLALP